jgi:hypothetical protein
MAARVVHRAGHLWRGGICAAGGEWCGEIRGNLGCEDGAGGREDKLLSDSSEQCLGEAYDN